MFRLGDQRGEATETRKSGFGIIIAETRGHVLSIDTIVKNTTHKYNFVASPTLI
jgi:hypothetical protein